MNKDLKSIKFPGLEDTYVIPEGVSTSILPNNNGEIKTKYRVANKGNTGSGTTNWYYKLCTLPINNDFNYASAIISGRIGGWTSDNMSYINALVWNRGTPGIALIDIAGSAPSANNIWNMTNLVLYINNDNTATLYLHCKSYFTFDLDIEVFQSTANIVYDGTYITTTPSGTLADSASTSTKRMELINGKLLINGEEIKQVPSCSTSDNGKFLRVVNGVAAWQTVQNAEEVSV